MDNKNNISFKHFIGTESEWEQRLRMNDWANAVVFGKVWNTTVTPATCSFKICAGKVKLDDETMSDYFVHEYPSFEDLKNIEDKLNEVKETIDIDASINFTNETFRQAIENYLEDSQIIKDINEAIEYLDSSLGTLNTTVQETIHWIDENGQIK